jgi:LPS-assembly lipoprotein
MSFYKAKIAIMILCAAGLVGCGFVPVYGTNGSGGDLRHNIRLDDPQNRLDFVANDHFEHRLGRPDANAQYQLSIDVDRTQQSRAITTAGDASRINLEGRATYELRGITSTQMIETGTVETFTSYSVADSPVATNAARRDAEDRLMIALIDQIISRLAISAADWP